MRKYIIWLVVVLAAGGVIYHYAFGNKSAPTLISAARGDISEEVIVTGNTTPVSDINLGFQTAGRIAVVHVDVGEKVTVGEALAELDASQLKAQVRQAQASVDAAQAKLDSLKKGTRPENIQITQTAIAKAKQDLANDYNGVVAILDDAYAKANDAVRNQVNALFTNADMINPQLTFPVADSQIQINAQSGRVLVGGELNAWKNELSGFNTMTADASPDALDNAIKNAASHLNVTLNFLNTLMNALVNSPNLSAATLTAYKTSVTTAASETSVAITNVNNVSQAIASQKIVVKQNQDQLALELAGTTQEDIRAQEAAVAQARANVAVVETQLAETVIRSPINGTVTKQGAKVGEIASPNTILVSVVSLDNLEIDSNVPEVDIGKISAGNPVNITLDAFPGETFTGKVTKIDPAETVIGGVVNFKVTINFDKIDQRFKSGLTANLTIKAKKKTGVLILPAVAIIQNDSGAFVKKYENGAAREVPVTLGVRDQSGRVEIVSGVSEGEKVVNVGLKTK